jgi:hypothetical protein
MLRFGLDRMLAAHTSSALAAWLADARAEAGRMRALRDPDSPPPDFDRFRGPTVVAQVLAGNVAALAVPRIGSARPSAVVPLPGRPHHPVLC